VSIGVEEANSVALQPTPLLAESSFQHSRHYRKRDVLAVLVGTGML
jgi:hypothetical protein